ncbi:MAG: hypothetical protein KA715_06850 [Xanthomonadaceae bacterium]|nr:hypothetical protein [Xanthomonadaceae bacterium]
MRLQLILISVFLCHAPVQASVSDQYCALPQNLADLIPQKQLDEIRNALHGATAAEILKDGIPKFCKDTTKYQMEQVIGIVPDGTEIPKTLKTFHAKKTETYVWKSRVKDAAELESIIQSTPERIFGDFRNGPDDNNINMHWMVSTYPDSRVRKSGYDHKVAGFNDFVAVENISDVRKILNDPVNGPYLFPSHLTTKQLLKQYIPLMKANEGAKSVQQKKNIESQAKLMLSNLQKKYPGYEHPEGIFAIKGEYSEDNALDLLKKRNADNADEIENLRFQATQLCMTYDFSSSLKCGEGLKKIADTMAPRENITALPVMAEVLNDEIYAKGASRAALKIIDRVEKKDLTGDVLSDFVKSFQEIGLTKSQAEDRAWKLLAVWAARGPNLSVLSGFINSKNFNTLFALHMISSAAPYLDQLRIENKKNPYSYPPEVQTQCSYGKPYHFWLTAFLARKIGKESGDPKAGLYASYLSQLGYQMKSKTTGRDPTRIFTLDGFDPANNKLRLDMGFASAGAVYGMRAVSQEKQKTLDVDGAIEEMIKSSSPSEKLSKESAEKLWYGTGLDGYARWKSIIAPDQALEKLMK